VTVSNHIGYQCETFLFYRVKRYGIREKRYFETEDKYRLVDPAFVAKGHSGDRYSKVAGWVANKQIGSRTISSRAPWIERRQLT